MAAEIQNDREEEKEGITVATFSILQVKDDLATVVIDAGIGKHRRYEIVMRTGGKDRFFLKYKGVKFDE